jgi:hypothetical protein
MPFKFSSIRDPFLPTFPNYPKYKGSEDEFQMKVALYLDLINAVWFHPANERKTKVYINNKGQRFSPEGNKLRAKGVKSGVPDCMILNGRHGWAGLAIELKVGSNTLSASQIEFLTKLNGQGWLCFVSWSLEEVVALLEWYFEKGKKNFLL